MAEFLEERLAVVVNTGSTYGDSYEVEITTTSTGAEHRRLIHPFPVRRFRISTLAAASDLYAQVLNLYHRAYGKYAGFRVTSIDDNSTNGQVGTPSAVDQTLALVSTGVYQLQKAYGAGATPLAIGLPKRTIFKPVAGTTLIAVAGITIPATGYSVDTTTGRVTFSADKVKTVTGITKAASAVVAVGSHTYVVGESVYFTGIVGMTQINGLRGLITAIGATDITVAINSSTFSTWSSGGSQTVKTLPQSGEVVTGGCLFDIPARFDTSVEVAQDYPNHRVVEGIEIIELINP